MAKRKTTRRPAGSFSRSYSRSSGGYTNSKRSSSGRGKKNKNNDGVRSSVLALIFFAIGVLILISFANQGAFLSQVNTFCTEKFGFAMILLPFVIIAGGLTFLDIEAPWSKKSVLWGSLVLFLGLLIVGRGGAIGMGIFNTLSGLISKPGAYILGTIILIMGLIITCQISLSEMIEKWREWQVERQALALEKQEEELADSEDEEETKWLKNDQEKDIFAEDEKKGKGFSLAKLSFGQKKTAEKNESDLKQEEKNLNIDGESDQKMVSEDVLPKVTLLNPQKSYALSSTQDTSINTKQLGEEIDQKQLIWEYPSLDILSNLDSGQADRGDVRSNAQIIEETLKSFGIKAKVAEVNRGPSVTQYALDIAMGTKISKITSLSNNLALALAAPNGQIRIEAPIAGKSLVGIEVPNVRAAYVTLRQMLGSPQMKKNPSKLAVALGINISGQPMVADITKMPHALIAGATGSGKSVGINSFLCSILFRASPSEVKFILVDPKRVEMTPYKDIPHLLTPVIHEAKEVVSALKWLVHEMEQRYKRLAEVGVKNLASYNELAGFTAMPNIVLMIDEFADIMMYAPAEVEESITRIAQMARAVGIHMILSTQRPSVNVITGLIKANIPTRISFNVTSVMDSRVVLDTTGAEKLLGSGDMLFIPPDQAKPIRIQGTFVSDDDVRRLTDYLKGQNFRPEYIGDVTKYEVIGGNGRGRGGAGGGIEGDGDDRDSLFTEAAKMFSSQPVASSSLIQRRLSVGYARAARILDQLYEAGLVGPANGSKPREVYRDKIIEFLTTNSQLES